MSGVYRGQVEGDASLRLGAALCMRFPPLPLGVVSSSPSHPASRPLSQPLRLLPTLSCWLPPPPHPPPFLVCDSTPSASDTRDPVHSGGQGGRQCGGEWATPGQAKGG